MTIAVENLTKRYGEFLAVDHIHFDVHHGEVFGFLGPNGAGKTSTIRMMVGLLRPTSGRVLLDGIDMQQDPKAAKRTLGFAPDEPHLFDGLTGWEFLSYLGELYGLPRPERVERARELVERFDLGDHAGQATGGYSHGTKQKLALAGAMIHRPTNLFLDEPTVGLDPKSAFVLKETLRDHANRGGTVFLSTHILEIAQNICDRVGIIDHGRLLAVGTVDELRSQVGDGSASLETVFLQLTGAARPAEQPALADTIASG